MLRNYLITSLRNLSRNRLYAAINILGLAVGVAAALFAGLFVYNELTYEHWIPGYERIYEVTSKFGHMRGAAPSEEDASYREVAADLMLDFPQVESAARISGPQEAILSHGDIRSLEQSVVSADPALFEVLAVPTVAGDLRAALSRPDGVVLTRTAARKYFGRDAPLGETIEVDGHPLAVTAVIDDWPSNTRFSAQVFVSSKAKFSSLARLDARSFTPEEDPWSFVNVRTFFRLKRGASIDLLQKAMPAFIARHVPRNLISDLTMSLRPISSMHLNPVAGLLPTRASLLTAIFGAAGLAVLVLIAATINFVNVMTARAAQRAVEVGVRKVTGAQRRNLIVQFLGESALYVLLGTTVAILLVETLLPAYRSFFRSRVLFDPWHDPLLAGSIIGFTVLAALLSGAYPAVVLSSFRPATILRGRSVRGGTDRVRPALVAVQFAILIGTGVAAIVVYRQTDYAMNAALRFDKDLALIVTRGCLPAFKTEIEALPGVRAAACSWNAPGFPGYRTGVSTPGHVRVGDMGVTPIDLDYFEVYGLHPLAGRFFRHGDSGDEAVENSSVNPTVVINETAARRLGFSSPQPAVGQTLSWRRILPSRQALDQMPLLPSRIIGVVNDFSMDVRTSAQPMLYYADMRMSVPAGSFGAQDLNVRLDGRTVPETLRAIDHLWAKSGSSGWPIQRAFLNQQLQEFYLDISREGTLLAVLAGIALCIAALGLFSLTAFTAERRTKEICIRKTMGASRTDILRMLLWQFTQPVLWANVIAWPVAYVIMRRWLEGFAYHIDLRAWMFFSASATACLIALLTVIGHALLIARARPVAALRYE